jgi:hypothetical protein
MYYFSSLQVNKSEDYKRSNANPIYICRPPFQITCPNAMFPGFRLFDLLGLVKLEKMPALEKAVNQQVKAPAPK